MKRTRKNRLESIFVENEVTLPSCSFRSKLSAGMVGIWVKRSQFLYFTSTLWVECDDPDKSRSDVKAIYQKNSLPMYI